MPDYKNGRIYKILNSIDDEIYVGSTTASLSRRMGKHRSDHRCNEKKQKYKIYTHMTKVGADNFYIELIEAYPCNSKEELDAKEGQWIRQIGTLNTIINGRTKNDVRQDNIERYQEYARNHYKRHQEQILQDIKERCTCECGTDVNIHHISRHRNTTKHKQLMEQLNSTME